VNIWVKGAWFFKQTRLDALMFRREEDNIAIMHVFVDLLDFTSLPFTDALRLFLQSFRLPGEAQKIDRFMLKFAERYIGNNPNSFANAGTLVANINIWLLSYAFGTI
jgi:brefeldin A-inhibited guanine nucleotide-exchange protein